MIECFIWLVLKPCWGRKSRNCVESLCMALNTKLGIWTFNFKAMGDIDVFMYIPRIDTGTKLLLFIIE